MDADPMVAVEMQRWSPSIVLEIASIVRNNYSKRQRLLV
jgi:hypothetical protein